MYRYQKQLLLNFILFIKGKVRRFYTRIRKLYRKCAGFMDFIHGGGGGKMGKLLWRKPTPVFDADI